MVIFAPRMALSAFGSSPTISCPRYVAEPVTVPLAARRPMMPIMVWLLPEPLSPTTASVSPGRTSRSMPLTAFTSPSGVVKETLRSRTDRIGSMAFVSSVMSAVLRVERVAQAVADEIQREERDDEEDGGEDK